MKSPISLVRKRLSLLRRKHVLLTGDDKKLNQKKMNQAMFHLLILQQRPFNAFKKNDGATTSNVSNHTHPRTTRQDMSAPGSPRATFAVPYGNGVETREQIERRGERLAQQEEIYHLSQRIEAVKQRISMAYGDITQIDVVRRLQRQLGQFEHQLVQLRMRPFA